MHSSTPSPVRRRAGRAGAVVVTTALAATALAVGPALASALSFRGDLRDFAPSAAGPFDGARAKLTLVSPGPAQGNSREASSQAVLVVHGVDPSVAGRTFGAHLHNGPCVAGNGAAALGHYNHSTTVPATVNDQTEIWLDFTVDAGGNAQSTARVDWVPTPGDRSVVVHANPTAADGTAGARLACLPVQW